MQMLKPSVYLLDWRPTVNGGVKGELNCDVLCPRTLAVELPLAKASKETRHYPPYNSVKTWNFSVAVIQLTDISPFSGAVMWANFPSMNRVSVFCLVNVWCGEIISPSLLWGFLTLKCIQAGKTCRKFLSSKGSQCFIAAASLVTLNQQFFKENSYSFLPKS